MTPWTVWERMLLHVLFGYYKLDFYGREWWAIYREITKTTRLERTCREDYKYSHGKERTQMYPRRILKPYNQYDDEERAAYDDAFQNVIDAAKRLGIVLPGSNGDEDEEDAMDEDEDKRLRTRSLRMKRLILSKIRMRITRTKMNMRRFRMKELLRRKMLKKTTPQPWRTAPRWTMKTKTPAHKMEKLMRISRWKTK